MPILFISDGSMPERDSQGWKFFTTLSGAALKRRLKGSLSSTCSSLKTSLTAMEQQNEDSQEPENQSVLTGYLKYAAVCVQQRCPHLGAWGFYTSMQSSHTHTHTHAHTRTHTHTHTHMRLCTRKEICVFESLTDAMHTVYCVYIFGLSTCSIVLMWVR